MIIESLHNRTLCHDVVHYRKGATNAKKYFGNFRFLTGVFLASVFLFFLPLHAQQADSSSAQIYLRQAQNLFAQGKYPAAKKAFEKALKADESLTEAHAGLGKIAIASEDWRKANGHFDKALKRDPDNFEAHYFRAICYREIGKFRPEFLRKTPLIGGLLEFKKAKNHFNWIMSRDSLYRDVIYQYAILKSYQEKFTEALKIAHRQIALKPTEIPAQVGIFEMYRQFMIRKNLRNLQKTLAGWPWPHARFFIGEKLRREKKLAQADSIFLDLLGEEPAMPLQPVYLALVKSYFKQGKRSLAESEYWRAVDSIEDHTGADLIFEDLKYVINDAELHTYRRLQSAKEKGEFFRAFWTRRNPMPAAKLNVRLAEHYRRLIYVEDDYEYVGFRSWVNSPDKLNYLNFPESYRLNKEFNDKGLVYLRHGPPDDRIATVGSGAFSSASIPESNESWKYWQTEQSPEMTFHFLYDKDATGNLWRLTPFLDHPAMLEDRYDWDPVYYRLQTARNAGERFILQEEMARISKASVDTGFATDRHSWNRKIKPLKLPFSAATFRGNAGQTVLEIYFGIPLLPIAKALPKQANAMQIEQGIAIHNSSWRQVRESLQNVAIPYERKKLKADNLFTDFYRTSLKPGGYFAAIHAKPQNTNLLGGHARIKVTVPDYSGADLSMSDIELASLIQPAENPGKLVKNGLLVVPNPTSQYERKKPVHLYFEVYNLARGANGKTDFSVEYTVAKKDKKGKLFGLFGGGKSSISVKADRQSSEAFSAEFLAIDVQKLGKGEVVLTIQVTDKRTGDSVSRENVFVLY